MSTAVTLSVLNGKSPGEVEYDFERYDAGPCICYNGGSELAHCLSRYTEREITPKRRKRILELFDFLHRDSVDWKDESDVREEVSKWLKEHEGERLLLMHQ